MPYKRFPAYLKHSHSPESIKARLEELKRTSLVRDFVYGAIDGTVTTFAIVAGVSGANLSEMTILILGLSNVLADGFSMAAGNYLGTKTQTDEKKLIRDFEETQIQHEPDGEREELRQIFKAKGFEGETLDKIVSVISSDRERWLSTMLNEEYGISDVHLSPLKSGLVTFGAFLVFGMVPILPFLLPIEQKFMMATILTGVAFFGLGALKSFWSLEHWIPSAFKTFGIGAAAAGLAYFVGTFFKV